MAERIVDGLRYDTSTATLVHWVASDTGVRELYRTARGRWFTLSHLSSPQIAPMGPYEAQEYLINQIGPEAHQAILKHFSGAVEDA